jgi:hypothetical protein
MPTKGVKNCYLLNLNKLADDLLITNCSYIQYKYM